MSKTSVEIIGNGGSDPDGSARFLGRWTFQYHAARSIVREEMQGRVLNACAGKTQLNGRSPRLNAREQRCFNAARFIAT